jgi:hypothetical protein
MLGKLFGRGGNPAISGPFHRPYKSATVNRIYNLLYCDNLSLLKEDRETAPLAAVLSDAAERETLERIGNNLDVESRVRVVAFNRLRAMGKSVPRKRLLGSIVEVPQRLGLDVLAAFPDGSLRYINQSEKLAIFEPPTPPELVEKLEEVLRVSQFIVNRYQPWDKPRRPPPTGSLIRMTFLASDGIYFGEGRYPDLMADRLAAPVITAAGELLNLTVDVALTKGKALDWRE